MSADRTSSRWKRFLAFLDRASGATGRIQSAGYDEARAASDHHRGWLNGPGSVK